MSGLRYYKVTRPDGTDVHTATIDYAAALESGEIIRHPEKMVRDDPATYLSVSIDPANCTGMRWPCRLFRVEPLGRTLQARVSDSKRSCSALRVVEELPAHMALGPQGEQVAALIERAGRLTTDEIVRLVAAWDAAWVAAWDAAWVAARDAARGAARGAAWVAAWDAAWDAARGAAWGAAWVAAWDAARGAAWDAARGAAWVAAWDAARGAARDAARGAAWVAARDAARDAALALATRDLISDEHFDVLYGPWRDVIGEPVA